jgi:hypothetical protein
MDKWILCVFALVLGMIMFHMLKSVCRCKSDVVEGVEGVEVEDEYGCTPETAAAGECGSGSNSFLDQLGTQSTGKQSTDIRGDKDKCEPLIEYTDAYDECINGSGIGEEERNGLCKEVTDATDAIAAEKLARGTAAAAGAAVEDRTSHRLTAIMDSVTRNCAGSRCCSLYKIVPPGLRFSAFCRDGYWKVIKDGGKLGECMDEYYKVDDDD